MTYFVHLFKILTISFSNFTFYFQKRIIQIQKVIVSIINNKLYWSIVFEFRDGINVFMSPWLYIRLHKCRCK